MNLAQIFFNTLNIKNFLGEVKLAELSNIKLWCSEVMVCKKKSFQL